jgi:hypothetical protein
MPISAPRPARLGVLVVVAAALALGGACGSDPEPTDAGVQRPPVTQDPSPTTEADPVANVVEREAALAAVRQQIQLLERADWPGAWAALHPAQQALVSQSAFAACAARRWGPALDVLEVHLVRVTKGNVEVAGTTEKAPGYRAEFRVVGTDPSGPFDAATTYGEVDVGGTWRWTLKDPGAYSAGRCPADDDTLT